MEPDRWSDKDLVELAATHGSVVSVRQLERWHKADLLPRPRVERLGKGHGTASFYPQKTGDYLLAICRLKAAGKGRPLERLRFELWWLGFEIPLPNARQSLVAMLRPIRDMTENVMGHDVSHELAAIENETDRTGLAAHMRQALRPHPYELVDLIAVVLDRATGNARQFDVPIDRSVSDRTFLDALNDVASFDGVRSVPVETTVWGDALGKTLPIAIDLLRRDPGSTLARVSDERLLAARDAARSLAEPIPRIARTLHAMNGRDTGGLRMLRQAAETAERPVMRAWLVLTLAAGMPQDDDRLLEAAGIINELAEQFQVIDRMLDVIPMLKGIGADPQRVDRLSAAEREQLNDEFARYRAAHPEDQRAIDRSLSG